MNKQLLGKFMEKLNRTDAYERLLNCIAYHTAPTLLSIKPSCLLSLTETRGFLSTWDIFKEKICFRLGLDYVEIKKVPERVLVLFYNRDLLKEHLAIAENKEFLKKWGYQETENLEKSFGLLRDRFTVGCPHEIGIFLGYPLQDVRGFIQHQGRKRHQGRKSLSGRYWIVYSNPERAEQIFRSYDLAKLMVMLVMLDPGFSLGWIEKRISQ